MTISLCSGVIFSKEAEPFDWARNESSRFLLTKPLDLSVCSLPLDAFPQELCLRFDGYINFLYRRTPEGSFNTSGYLADVQVAQDFAAVLTLLCRRLIVVAAKVRERHESRKSPVSSALEDRPMPIIGLPSAPSWTRRPIEMHYGSWGTVDAVVDNNPPPVAVNRDALNRVLVALPNLEHSEAIILSARLYATALEMIESRPDISYQLLISSAEVMANTVLGSFQPSNDEMIKTKRPIYEMARNFNLSNEQAAQLAVAACQGMAWTKKKFEKFLDENATDELWTIDPLFDTTTFPRFLPAEDDFNKALNLVYEMRSSALHGGRPYPPSAISGATRKMSAEAMLDAIEPRDGNKVLHPPVTWFERVVGIAIREYIRKVVGLTETVAEEIGRGGSAWRPNETP